MWCSLTLMPQLLVLTRLYCRRQNHVLHRCLVLKKASRVEVKVVLRRLTAFVGRLDVETTADDLTSFLAESGLQGVKCTKLKFAKMIRK